LANQNRSNTAEPGRLLYTGSVLTGKTPNDIGRGGKLYVPRGAVCLETQSLPDSPNNANSPMTVVHPGQRFTSTTVGQPSPRFPVPIGPFSIPTVVDTPPAAATSSTTRSGSKGFAMKSKAPAWSVARASQVADGRDDDHRDAGMNRLKDRASVQDAGHVEVEEHDLRQPLADSGNRGSPGGRRLHDVALEEQTHTEQVENIRFIVDDEDPGGHAGILPKRGSTAGTSPSRLGPGYAATAILVRG
jgi:hypothetical protein